MRVVYQVCCGVDVHKSFLVATIITTAVYHIMKNGEVWNPSDLSEIDLTPEMAEKRRARDIKRAVNLLVAEGIISAESQLSLS